MRCPLPGLKIVNQSILVTIFSILFFFFFLRYTRVILINSQKSVNQPANRQFVSDARRNLKTFLLPSPDSYCFRRHYSVRTKARTPNIIFLSGFVALSAFCLCACHSQDRKQRNKTVINQLPLLWRGGGARLLKQPIHYYNIIITYY